MKALGMIETYGMITAIEAADVMLKVAEVTLIGYEKVRGGQVMVSVEGDVGAVKTAVDAAKNAVHRLNEISLVSAHVIPRPDNQLSHLYRQESIEISLEKTYENRINKKEEQSEDPCHLNETCQNILDEMAKLTYKEYKRLLEKTKADDLRKLVVANNHLEISLDELQKMIRRDMIDILLEDYKIAKNE